MSETIIIVRSSSRLPISEKCWRAVWNAYEVLRDTPDWEREQREARALADYNERGSPALDEIVNDIREMCW